MSVGQLLSDTFGIVKSRFGQLLALWAIYFGIMIVLLFAFAIATGTAGMASLATRVGGEAMSAEGTIAGGAAMVLLMIVFYIGYLLVAMAQYASLIALASPIQRLTVGEALGVGWRAAPALLLLMIVLMIGYFVGAIVVSLVGALLSAIGDWARAPLVLLMIPALVWLGCRLSPLFAVVAVDGVRNPLTAITRTWDMTRGHALTIFLTTLVFVVLLLLACGVVLLPSIGLLRSMSDPAALAAEGSAVGGLLLLVAGFVMVSVLFNLCYCAFMAAIHGRLANASGESVVETFA